jgi:DNA helicase-2/ATP-dependent DNA helicase PcrA
MGSATNQAFSQAYKNLNSEQQRAVDTLEGPVMIVAGPGTGKTQTIAMRIANILVKTDADPDAILALTFTESGAEAMQRRLVSLIGTTAYYCHIGTFHSFCSEVIRDNPDICTLDMSTEPITELEKLKLIYRELATKKYHVLSPVGAPYYYASSVIRAISDLKREGVTPDALKLLLDQEARVLEQEHETLKKTEFAMRQKNLQKNEELCHLYRAYESGLHADRRYDFDDIIQVVVQAFQTNEELLRTYQERFQYILVDEYQDTNSAQNQLVLLLAAYWGPQANLCVAGDPDQSIMRFQGASIENQLTFIESYRDAAVITLRDNYRSGQKILDAAHALITHNNLRIHDVVEVPDLPLCASPHQASSLRHLHVNSSLAERIFLAKDIKQKLAEGVDPDSIAVIYRKNSEAKGIIEVLTKYQLPYRVQGGADVLADPVVRNFLRLFKVMNLLKEQGEDEDFFTLLHYPIFRVDSLDILKLSRYAAENRLSLFDIVGDSALLDSLSLPTGGAMKVVLEKLLSWQSLDATLTFTELFERVLNESGYLNWVLSKSDAPHQLFRLNILFDEVKRMNDADHELGIASFLENIALMEANNLRIEESPYGKSAHAVTLTTAHSSKGLEWDYVYVVHATDGTWGNNKMRSLLTLPETVLKHAKQNLKEKNEDERRLFYVAITRARQELIVTEADTYQVLGTTKKNIPTMFLSELGEDKVTHETASDIEQAAADHVATLLTTESDQMEMSLDETEYLQALVAKFALSSTALNTYLKCGYLFKLDKLLAVPRAKKPHLAYGTAIHKALELFYRELSSRNVLPTAEWLVIAFENALSKELLTKEEFSVRLREGTKLLRAYYDYHHGTFIAPLFLEKYIRVHLDDYTLTGKVDRIEWLDQEARTVRVVDYKTGKAKTMGEIMGDTKSSAGDLKRQLVFYKLLIEMDPRLQNLHFGEATLDFVEEPSVHGKSGERSIAVSDEDVRELTSEIKTAMTGIRSLRFDRTTDQSHCRSCPFLDHCYPDGLPENT